MRTMSQTAMTQKIVKTKDAWPKSRDDYSIPISVTIDSDRFGGGYIESTDSFGNKYKSKRPTRDALFLRVTTGGSGFGHYSQIKLDFNQILDMATDEQLLDLLNKRSKERQRKIRTMEKNQEEQDEKIKKLFKEIERLDNDDDDIIKRLKKVEGTTEKIAKALQE